MATDAKGQVTLFIVIGLAVLIGAALFLLLRQRAAAPEVLPAEFQPVQEHVQQCLRDTTIDGLKLLAMHGGYLDPLDANETGRHLTLDPLDPTESDLVRLNPADNDSAIPYYSYLVGSDTCQFCLLTTLTPSKEQMEAELKGYVLAHLSDCVNYGLFPDIEVNAAPQQDLTVTLGDTGVIIDYERRLDLRKGESTVTARSFVQTLPIPFLRYYEAAKQITQREIDTQFLENYLMYLVSAYSGIHAELPPIAGYEEGFSPAFWVLPNVHQTYREIVESVTPALRVLGTKGATPPPTVQDPYVAGFLDMTGLDLFNGSGIRTDDLSVSILEPGLPIYLDVNPRNGMVIEPRSERQSGVLLVPPRQQNYYDFAYDISVPFIVEIRQTNAVPGTDISFLFALEANVRENKNMAQWLLGRGTIPWSEDFVQYHVEDPAGAETGTGAAPPPRYRHNDSVQTLLCDASQGTSNVSLQVFDAMTGKPLPGVRFSYACGYYASCSAGASAMDGTYAVLDAGLPPCLGGTLTAEKAGYDTARMRISTRPGERQALPALLLEPLVTRNVTVEKLLVGRDAATGQPRLDGNGTINLSRETVFITFVRQGDDAGPVAATALFSNDTLVDQVALIPGIYEVKALYLDNQGFTIPKGCKRVCSHKNVLGSCTGYTYLPENDTEIKPAPWGGLELSNETFFWHLGRDELKRGTTITVPVFVAPPPRCLDDLEAMGDTKLYVRLFRDKAMPRVR